jgi:predicted ester cyclase
MQVGAPEWRRKQPQEEPTMSTEENKAIVIRLVESINRRDLGALDAHPGMRETKEFLGRYFAAFPDARTTIEELVAEGEWVAARMISRGTQLGEWAGRPPTGQPIAAEIVNMHRIVDGRIVVAYGQGGPIDEVA